MEHNQIHGVPSITVEHFINAIGIGEGYKQRVLEWWNENKSQINIYYFPFKTNVMMSGCILSTDSIAINSTFENKSENLLYVALHESAHAQQELDGRLSPYFDTAVQNDLEGFLEVYKTLETEANDFAHSVMIEMGFDSFISEYGSSLRFNELAGRMVFETMKREIEKNNPSNFMEMFEKMIFGAV